MIITSNKQSPIKLVAVSYDTATYHDLQCFVSEHQGYVLERIDPEDFLTSSIFSGSYINLVIRDVDLRKSVSRHLNQYSVDRFSLIHDRAYVADVDSISSGCMIYPMSVLYSGAQIGQDVIVHSLTLIAHGCYIGTGVFISGGITIAGDTTIGDFTHIGIDATIYDQISVAPDTVIGAATVIRKSIAEPGTYSGQLKHNLVKIK